MHVCRSEQFSQFSSKSLREPQNVLHSYRCLQVLDAELNSLTRHYFFLVNHIVIILAVLCCSSVVRYHGQSSELVSLILPLIAAFASAYFLASYIKLGKYNEASRVLVCSWKKNTTLSPTDQKFMIKYMNSCRLLRTDYSEFGYFKKSGSIGIIGKLVFYTTKVLMMTKRYS
jgi:hypothetical protein